MISFEEEMISFNEQLEVASAMEKYGGSFVEYLGKALRRADPDNASRIKDAFSEYWEKYAGLYERKAKDED